MRKKLFKYIKFLVSMVLILSLVAPSYASLSASDGSAFVTKAEFDSALADFNSRLTTFEAGINSKIDSQVTSYLDRNGIWSGVVAELISQPSTNGYVKIVGNQTYTPTGEKWAPANKARWFYGDDNVPKLQLNQSGSTWSTVQALGGFGNTAWMRYPSNSYAIFSYPVAFKCPKSGLAACVVNCTGSESRYGATLESKDKSGNYWYAESIGQLWSDAPLTTLCGVVRDDNYNMTVKDAVVAFKTDPGHIRAIFNEQNMPRNIGLSPNSSQDVAYQIQFVGNGRVQMRYDEAYRLIDTNYLYNYLIGEGEWPTITKGKANGDVNAISGGQVLLAGTWNSYFFVNKNDIIWTAFYRYFLTTNSNMYFDEKFGAGNGYAYGTVEVKVY